MSVDTNMTIQEHIFTRPALMENLNRFAEIINVQKETRMNQIKWDDSFIKGMKHIINLTHLFVNGKITEEDVLKGTSRRYYSEEFLSECCAKLFEFTAILDMHYDGCLHEDVKDFVFDEVPVCTPKMIEYVGQNLIRRIMYIAVKNEIDAFVHEHPEMLPYPMLNETPGLFYLRVLLSSVYMSIARTTKHNPVVRRALLTNFVQITIMIVPLWVVVDLMNYPFTKAPIRTTPSETKEDEVLLNDVGVVENQVQETSVQEEPVKDEPVQEVSVQTESVEEISIAEQLASATPAVNEFVRRRHVLPECLMKFNLRKLITQRLKEAKDSFVKRNA